MNTAFSGFVSINDKEYPFTFSDYVLVIEGDFSMYTDPGRKLWDKLDGTITNEPCIVSFFLHSISRVSFKEKGYSSTSIHIPVQFYVVFGHEYNKEDVILKFKNSSFSKWLGLVPIHKVEQKEHCFEDKVVYMRDLESQSAVFNLEDKSFTAFPAADSFYSIVDFNYYPSLIVKCLDSMELIDLFHTSSAVIDFVRFCFFRKLVDVGDIDICCKENQNEVIGYHRVGSLHINYKRKEIEPIELNSRTDYGFIPWPSIYSHIPQLMALINNSDIYLDHLPEQRIDRFIVNYYSLTMDAAAFEYEFKERFPEYETTKKTDEKYITLKKKLEEIELTKACRELLDDLVGRYFDQPALLERAEYAITQYVDLLQPFFKKISLERFDCHKIARTFKESRNNVGHGSTNLRITSDIARSSLVIRAVIICMQLERIGMEQELISKVIRMLFDCVHF